MTREFAKQQLARIQAWWPSLPATKEAVNELVRALSGFTDSEIEKGVTDIIDTHLEPGAPKLGHIIAKVRVQRPRTFESATEEERELFYPEQRRALEQRVADELHALESWVARTEGAQAYYDAVMTDLLRGWAPDGIAAGRKALHPTVLRRTQAELGHDRKLRIV